jgi:hypothetical protein
MEKCTFKKKKKTRKKLKIAFKKEAIQVVCSLCLLKITPNFRSAKSPIIHLFFIIAILRTKVIKSLR